MSEDPKAQAPALEASANQADEDQPAISQAALATPDFNVLRSAVRESTARLQYPETGEWTAEDLENIETAEDLSPEQWNKIFRINKVLYGFTIRESESDIVKARQQAFVLQPPPTVQDPVLSGLPEYEVCDSSSISIKQIKTDLQRSLAENGFSAKSISTALGGGAFGVTAGISASLKAESTQTNVVDRDKAEMEYYAAYNFPRARLFLDEDNLALSPQCQRALEAIRRDRTDQQLRKFSEKFGHIFVTACQLGGQLQSSKFAGSLTESKDIQKQDALKSEMGINFNAQYASGSINHGRQRQTGSQDFTGHGVDVSSLAWTARGGNSLLCANPPGWARSVANPKHWRVIEQERVVTLHELIGRFEEWKDIPKLFEDIAQQRIKSGGREKPKWRNQIRLRLGDKRLAWNALDNKSLEVTGDSPEQGAGEPLFTVLGANIGDQSAVPFLPALPTDYPIYLLAGNEFQRNPKLNNQIQGIFVDEGGKIKPEMVESKLRQVTRFSIRLAGQGGWWRKYNQQPFETIQSGDKVNIYCHSVGVGPYANIEHPPGIATPVLYSPTERRLLLPASRRTLLNNGNLREILRQYDEGTLPVADRMGFEMKGHLTSDDRIGKIKADGAKFQSRILEALSYPSPVAARECWQKLSQLTGEGRSGLERFIWTPHLPDDVELAVFTITFE
ncbi:hypothetical protein CLCR_02283 [Cladophialophora carrionii]|uniref:MACPF-like domain-containing protein n=1 Tax=Cladophialophora carrionii TaxID=86049 RepID=A0A1C1CFJ2_9EURO|nr:hypothetical protein CLCR_02283 [Cladophialophora carrionii]